jgi:hypothetical protein
MSMRNHLVCKDIWVELNKFDPECSVKWDMAGGPEWLGNNEPRVYVLHEWNPPEVRIFFGEYNTAEVKGAGYNCIDKVWVFYNK